MKILLTGGAGFIGHNVSRILKSQGHDVVIVDSFTTYSFIPKVELQYLADNRLKDLLDQDVKVYNTDIRNTTELPNIFAEHRPDVVIHLASFPRQKVVGSNPLLASDVMSTGLVHLLELSKTYKVSKFVYISSSMVYGDFEQDVSEDSPCNPIGQYGILKLTGEKLVEDWHRQGHFDYTIIRPSAVYGEWDVEDRVVSKFMTQALRGEVLKVHGADEVLDFTYVGDTAMGIALAACSTTSNNKIYNITRSDDRLWTLKDAAELAISITGKGSLEIADRDLSFPKRGRLSISRAQQDLGYAPEVSVEQGFQKYYEWYQQNPVLWDKSTVQ